MECTAGARCGTYTGYVNEGGREAQCRPCLDAAAAYQRQRTRMRAYGKWEPFVEAEPVRVHVRALMGAGLKITDIMAAGGVGKTAIQRLLYGRPSSGEKPSGRVRHRIADAILAIPVPADEADDEDARILLERGVPLTNIVKRKIGNEGLGALAVELTSRGRSASAIAEQLSVTERTVVRHRARSRVAA